MLYFGLMTGVKTPVIDDHPSLLQVYGERRKTSGAGATVHLAAAGELFAAGYHGHGGYVDLQHCGCHLCG